MVSPDSVEDKTYILMKKNAMKILTNDQKIVPRYHF
jgi:hypothetical protein